MPTHATAGLRGATRAVRGPGAWLRRAAAIVRRIVGAPDYDTYLRHVREHHPGCTPLTRDEFVRRRMDAKYSTPGSRCC